MGATDYPIDEVRARFPAVHTSDRVFLDGPGGTQLCGSAIDAMRRHCEGGTANLGGRFEASREVGRLHEAAHEAAAALLGGHPGEIAFGPNMTTLTFAVARALARDWSAGDELVVTRLDHDANVAPWLRVARDRDMTVRWLDFDPATGRLELDDLPALLNSRTRLVAVGGASNALGTLNDVAAISDQVRARCDALIFVDAVQSVPHEATDVARLGCDLLACSPYKFYGPHLGILWAREAVLARLDVDKVRPAPADPPGRALETGTPSFEALASFLGTIEYLEWLGRRMDGGAEDRRARLLAAIAGANAHETSLGERLLAGLDGVGRLTVRGPPTMAGRVPTFGLECHGIEPAMLAERLGERGIHSWAGHFYAIECVARLGLADSGGLLRLGLAHYTTAEEIDRTIDSLKAILS